MHRYDYVIVGAGPAGLQLGYFLQQSGHDYLILEAGDEAGTFFQHFPRHRKLISINKLHTGTEDPETNLRWDWNSLLTNDYDSPFRDYSKKYFPDADELVRYLAAFRSQHQLNVRFGTSADRIRKEDGLFKVQASGGEEFVSRRLVVATGLFEPNIPSIPGIEHTEDYTTVSVDPNDFVNERVLIIGKGNSGFETADNLIDTAALIHLASPEPLRLAWQSHFVGHLRAVNNNIIDTYQLKSQNAILDATVESVRREQNQFVASFAYAHANGESEEIRYDRVITCAGFRFDRSPFDTDATPDVVIDERFPDQTSSWESVNVPGLYFAGALMQMRDYKVCTGAFIHGFRYNVRALARILDEVAHDRCWPRNELNSTADDFAAALIERINSTSALWQLFGFLGDLFVISEAGSERMVEHYEEVPVDYIHDTELGRNSHYYILTLEYGPNHDSIDPFNANRIERSDVENAELSNFLHPVIRRYCQHVQIAEHHVIEDLEANWKDEEHFAPLKQFLVEQLAEEIEPTW